MGEAWHGWTFSSITENTRVKTNFVAILHYRFFKEYGNSRTIWQLYAVFSWSFSQWLYSICYCLEETLLNFIQVSIYRIVSSCSYAFTCNVFNLIFASLLVPVTGFIHIFWERCLAEMVCRRRRMGHCTIVTCTLFQRPFRGL